MDLIQFLILKMWLVDGASQPTIDQTLLNLPKGRGWDCWKYINTECGFTRDYKHMFYFTNDYQTVDKGDLDQAIAQVREKLGHEIPAHTFRILEIFWQNYCSQRNAA